MDEVKYICPACRSPLNTSPERYSCSQCSVTYKVVKGIPLFTQENVSYKDEFTKPNLRVSPLLEFLYRHMHFYHWNEKCFFEDNVRKGDILLDLGCGGGKELFPHRGAYCVGIDLSLDALLNAATVYQQVARCDIVTLPFEDNTFDCVVSSHALEHIGSEKKDTLLREVFRVLKKGGRAVNVIETDSLNPFVKEAKHYPTCYGKYFVERDGHYGLELPSEIIKRFEKNGFTLVSCKKRNAWRVPPWFFVLYFDNEFLEDLPVRIRKKVRFARKLWENWYLKVLMGFLQGIYQDTWGQWFTKLDHSMGISTVHYK